MNDKNQTGKEKLFTPSLRKMLIMVVFLLLPILLVGISFLLYSDFQAHENSKSHILNSLDEELREIDESLAKMNVYTMETLVNNSQVFAVRTSENAHKRNIAARALQVDFDYQFSFSSSPFSLIYYSSSHDLTISRFDPTSSFLDNDLMRTKIKSMINNREYDINKIKWSYIMIDDRPYIFQLYKYKSDFIGCWISCKKLFSLITDTILTEEGFQILLDGEFTPLVDTINLTDAQKKLINSGNSIDLANGAIRELYKMHYADINLIIEDKPFVNRENLLYMFIFLTVILLIILAFSIYTLYYYHHYIAIPFRYFQHHIDEYSTDRRKAKMRGFAELNEAIEIFDSLTKQIHDLKIDTYEEKLVLANTELEYFQLQIKPHFFVNCFSIIFGMAQKKNYERIQEFCIKLSNYVRYLFNDGFNMVTIGEELSLMREYLDIQSIRHRAIANLRDSVEEDLYSYPIPPLIILTFVENSIKHANEKINELNISVDISKIESDDVSKLRIIISDNGNGFPKERLEKLDAYREFSEEKMPNSKHLGIQNIYKRLSLLYGDQFSLNFSNLDIGCKVEIVIPYQK